MSRKIMLTIVVALIAMSGSLQAEVSSVNLFDARVDPGFEDPNLSDWTVVGGSTVVDTFASNTGKNSLFYNGAWTPTVLGISDQQLNPAYVGDMMPAAANTDYLTGAWIKDWDIQTYKFLYFSTWDGVTDPAVGGLSHLTPYIKGVSDYDPDWKCYTAIINSGADGSALSFTINGANFDGSGPGYFSVDDLFCVEITDASTPHVLAWDESAAVNNALDLRGYVEAGTRPISTTTWSLVSGPGGVVFSPSGDGGTTANAVAATATFDAVGTYTLQLEAVDTAANAVAATATYNVTAPPAPGPPTNPDPVDSSTFISPETGLSWTPGQYADAQEVYFDSGSGLNLIATLSGTDGDLTNVEIGGPLDPNTVYSWQVVGYIGGTGGTPTAGDVWSFRTGFGGLVYHWPFDGSLDDIISGNHASDTGGGYSYVTGYVSKSVCDDPNGAVSLGVGQSLVSAFNVGITGNVPRTISCLYKPSVNNTAQTLVWYGDFLASNDLIDIRANWDTYIMGLFGTVWTTGSTVSYYPNEWSMATLVCDGTTSTIYHNGVANGSYTGTLATADSVMNFSGNPWNDPDVSLDDVRVYDVALTAEEVMILYLEYCFKDWLCVDPPEMDLTDDCRVNLEDLALIAGQWLDCGRYPEEACQL